jgi:hypothetical protein
LGPLREIDAQLIAKISPMVRCRLDREGASDNDRGKAARRPA